VSNLGQNQIKAVIDALLLLPEYADPDWEERPDDLRCDIQKAIDILTPAAMHTFESVDFGGDVCRKCGKDIRHAFHKRR
jgi:hypothetical protein